MRRISPSHLLAVSAALLLTAFLADSELATLRGAKAHDASAFLTRELGPPLGHDSLVRAPARNVRVTVAGDGFRLTHEKRSLLLRSPIAGTDWRSYEHGMRRMTPVGPETVLVDSESAEEFLTVTKRQGQKTWRWRLDSKLEPRANANGYVGFFAGQRLINLQIEPVAIFDSGGRDVTPRGLKWSVANRGKHNWLELTLDDRKLELPYTIDPTISWRTGGAVATSASGTTITVGIPATARSQDLLVLHVAVRSTTIPSTPSGWTLVTNTDTPNNNISQAAFWKKATASDMSSGSIGVTIPSAAAGGVISVYKGVDTSGSGPVAQFTTSATANNRNIVCPNLTTTAADRMAVCIGSHATNGTWPASGSGFTRRATGAQGTSISLGVYDQFVATNGTTVGATFSNVAAANTRNIGNTFGLAVDTDTPANGTVAITGVSPAGVAALLGGTVYYRGSVAGAFQLRDPFSDVMSAPESVNYPNVASAGWTHANETVTANPNFQSSNYSWTAGTTTPPTAAERTITEQDSAGNASTQVVPIVNDTTAPTGQTLTLTGANAPYYSSNSVSFTLGDGSDAGSGPDTATRTVTREHATLFGDVCSSFTADAGTYASPDTAVSSGNCYRYTFTIKDRVGNTSIGVSATAKVDGGAPAHGTIALTGVFPAGIAYLSGGTVYYRGSAAGQFQLRDPATDALTAADSVNYPNVASAGWTHANETVTTSPNFQSSSYSWTAGTTTPPAAAERTLTAADRAGNTATLAVPIVNDTTAPASQTITLTGTAASPNYYKTNSVSFTVGDGSDGGSGLDTSTGTVTREHAALSGDNCGTFTADAGTYTSPDTAVSSGNCYRYTFTIQDNVGNTSSGVTATAKVDGGAPLHGTVALTGVSPAGIAYLSGGGAVYFRGSAAGQFQLRDPATDSVTATASVNYPNIASAGWTHANETVTSAPNFQSSNYSWSAGTTTPPTAAERTLTAADQATNTSTLVLPIVNDTTAPSVTAPTVIAGYHTALSVGVTLNGGTDGGSGLAAGSSVVQRDEANLSNGSCDSFPGTWSPVTLTGGNDTTVQTGKCYQYREQLTDNVGNTGSSGVSSVAKVDTAGPTNALSLASLSPAGSALKNGNTIYYRGAQAGGGSFRLRNAVADGASGAASSQTAALGGTTTGWTHTPSTVSTPAGGPYDSNDFTWAQGTTSSPTEVVTGRDAADNPTAATALTFVDDSNAPAGGALTVNGTVASGGGTTGYDTDGGFTIGTRTDYAESQSATESGLASSTLIRTAATYSSPDTCGAFGSPTTITGNPDQTGFATGCYRYTLTGTDNVGNAVSLATTVKVDTSDPTAPTLNPSNPTGGAYYPGSGTRVYFRPDAANGGFDLAAGSTDADTGIASYAFPAGAALGVNWSASGSGSSRTYSYTATATSNGSQNVSATNNAGRSASSSFDIALDSTAPSVGALTVNGTVASGGGTTGYDTDGGFTIGTRTDYAESQSAAESGLASSTLVRTTATYSSPDTCGAFGSPTTITGNPDQTGLATGCYRYTLTGTDNVGNAVSLVTTVKVDTSAPGAPSLSFANPTGGAYYPGSGARVYFRPDAANGGFHVTASSADADTGVASYGFPAGSALGTNWSGSGSGNSRTYSYTATATSNGSQNVTAMNNAGGTSGNATFDVTSDAAAPTGGALSVNGTAASGATPVSYDADGSFTIGTRTDYAETQSSTDSGLVSSTLVRTTAAYSSVDMCGGFGSPTTITGNPDQTGLATGCYRYTLMGTDNVGNAVFIATIVKVDTSAPSNPSLTISNATGGTYYTGVGSQIFFQPTAASGAFDLAAASSDADTGIAGYSFPSAGSMGANWAVSGSGSSRSYSFTPTAAEPGTKSVSAANPAGGGANSSFTVTADSTAPTTTMQCNAAVCLNGTYYTSSPVSVTLSANDGAGSGLQKIRYTTDGSDPTPVNGSDYVGAFSINTTTTVKFRAYDNLGNEEAVGSHEILLDGTPPTVALTLSENPASGAQHVSGSTLFYRPGALGGTFRVEADAQDAQTAVTSVSFPLIANVTGGSSQGSAPYREDYTWSAFTTNATAHDVVATNGAGGTTPEPFTLTQDSTAPTGQALTLTGAGAPYYTSASVPFSLADGTDGGAGLATASRTVTRETGELSAGGACANFSADAGTFSSPDTAVSNGHCYRYSFTIADNVGNVSTTVTAVAKVDTQAPGTTIDTNPSDPTNDTTPTFAFSSDEAGSSFECRIDGGSWNSCASPDTLGALSAASHTYEVRATDAASNTDGTPASFTWTIDLTAPNTTIDSNPPAIDNDATPSFTFSSTEGGSTFECRMDAGSWGTCSTPYTHSPALAEGSHTFDVRTIDAAGNTDASPGSYTWTIDLVAPTVTITAPTTYLNSSDPATYPVTAATPNGDVTRIDFYECSNASAACSTGMWNQFGTDSSAPFSADWSTPGSDGARAIRAIAVDVGANTGDHVRTITIDRTAPTNVTVSYPNTYVFGSFTITTDNGTDTDVDGSTGTLEHRLGDLANNSCSSYGGWSAASSPDTLASGKCAQYRYRLADNAGNWTTATSSNEVKSDTAAPTSIQADPGANLRQTISFTAVASDTGGSSLSQVAFERRPASGGSWATIAADSTSPYGISFDTTSVADGPYDFRTVATDVAGNVETAPAVVANRRIDNTAPSATMLSPGNPVHGTVTLTSNTSDTGGSGISSVAYELAPNGGSFNSQAAGWDTTLAADGLYDLRVVATDVAGNETTSALITTRVDNTPPAVNFTAPASSAIVSTTVALTATASDASPASPPVSFAYKLSSDPPSSYTATGASWDTTALPAGDGLYDVRARATDNAGNSTTVEHTNIRVDNAAPAVAITAPPAAINGSVPSPTTFSANATDPGGSGVAKVDFFECSNQSIDCATGVWSPLGAVSAPGPYSVSWTIPGADGNHALAAVATDNAGHPTSAIRNVDLDRTAPNTTIVSKPGDPSNDVTPSFTFTSSDPGSTFECSIDSGAFAACTSPHSLPGLSDNDHDFEVRATDAAGNTDPTPDTWNWHRDTNAPTGTLSHPGANVRQTITLTSAENDPPANGYASGLASVTFEYSTDGTTWAPIGTNSSSPFSNMNWNTTGVTDGLYQLHIVVRDVAGNETTSAAVTNVRIDNTPPTTSHDDPGPYLRATKTLTGTAADAGSGVDRVDFERRPNGGGPWNSIATDSTPGDGISVSFDTTSVGDGHYDFRTVAYDIAGNQAAGMPVLDRLIDNTPPTATISSPGAYMRGAVNLTSSTGDPGGANASGVVSVAYEYSTNGGGSWQPTGSSFDTTAVADGNVQLRVIATDAAGNSTTSAAVTSLVDNTKPVTTDNAPAGWRSSAVTVTLSPSDAGSGVNVTEYSIDGNSSYTVGTSVVIPAPADGSNDGAHTIAYFSVDNAGNIETVKSTTVLIDATPPACPSCSAADYLRGTVTLNASPNESGSGIQSVEFEYTTAGGSSWTSVGTDTTGPAPYSVDWDTMPVADGHYDLRILVTDNANNVTTTNLPDKVVDNTAPDVANVGAPTEGQYVTGTVALAASASDATSPVASVKFYVRGSLLGTDTTAPFSLNWNTTTGADGGATIQVIVEDMAGNTTASATRNVSVDNLNPTPTLGDPGQNLSGTVSLSAGSDGDTTQVDFERRPAGGGAWVTIASDTTLPWSTSLDTTSLSDGLYDFRVVATDQTGHTGASPIRANIRIDNTNPAGSITTPANGTTVGGSGVALGGNYSDGGAGVASVHYEFRPTGGGSWSTIATSTTSPFGATWDATTVSTGSYDLRPVITDRAGNTFTGGTITVNVDVTAPTVALTNPGATISGTVSLNAAVTGSGAAQVAFSSTPAGGASWTTIGTDTSSPWSSAFDTTELTDGVYDLRAVVTDGLGNTSTDVVAGIRIDNTAPRIISTSPSEGSTVSSASAIVLFTNEPATPTSVTLDGRATVAPVISGNRIDFNTGSLSVGPHTLAGELQDASGKKTPFRVHFTVWSSNGSLAPHAEKNTGASTPTTVESPDGFAAATMPAGAWSTQSADWIVLRIAPRPAPSGLTNGFTAGPKALDVTAWWALAGTEVHVFSQPLNLLMRTSEKGLVPATFENGNWRVIPRVPTAGTLPAGWDDGFYTDAGGFHVLTKHLSLFALLHDVEAPNPPQNVRGFLGSGGLTIRWTEGADNSGTYDFVTVYSDAKDVGHFGVDYIAASIGAWAPGDQRVFRLKETDLAGNESALTRALVPVPSLVGKTPDEAEAILAQHGFRLGTLTPGGSGKSGTITGPEGLVLAEEGAVIDVTVAPGAALTRLVFRVHTAPKLKPAVRKTIAARVSLTRAGRVTAEIFSPRGGKLYTWRFTVKAGRTILKLKIPRQVRRPGLYSMRWTARAGGDSVSTRIKIRMLGVRTVKSAEPIEVVLAGQAPQGAGSKLPKQPKVVRATGVETTFDAAANRKSDTRVIVVDADEFGIQFIRDLHTVFPATKIVALSSSPRTMARALMAGAAIALPRSTPPAKLAKVIQKLLSPQKQAKPKAKRARAQRAQGVASKS